MSNVTTLPLAEATGPPDAGWLLDTYLRHHRALRDEARDRRRAEGGTTTTESWYASSLESCLRQQYMQRLGIPRTREIDEQTRRTFAWGDHVEDFLRKMYQRCGLIETTQWRLEHGSLVARGDVLLRFPPTSVESIPADVRAEWSPEWIAMLEGLRAEIASQGFTGLVGREIKSTHSRAMRFLHKEGKPRDSHAMQVGASMALTSLVPDAPRPNFWDVEYLGKDSVGVLRFRVEDVWAEAASRRWAELDEIWAARPEPHEVPCDCPTRFNGKGPQYCAYYIADAGSCCENAGLTAASVGDPY